MGRGKRRKREREGRRKGRREGRLERMREEGNNEWREGNVREVLETVYGGGGGGGDLIADRHLYELI